MSDSGTSSYSFLRAVGKTDIGCDPKRSKNEDAVLLMHDRGLFSVADGMGGMSQGAVASSVAVDVLRLSFASAPLECTLAKRIAIGQDALREADRRIKSLAAANPGTRMGSTVVVMVFAQQDPHRACVLHAGDSRAYCWRNRQLDQLTQDHSVARAVQMAPDLLPPDFRNVVTNGLGCTAHLTIESTFVDVRTGDLYLLCSDGLTQMISNSRLQQILLASSNISLEEMPAVLVSAANRAGGRDNISVVLISVGDIGVSATSRDALTADHTPSTRKGEPKKGAWVRLFVRLFARSPRVAFLAFLATAILTAAVVLWSRRHDGAKPTAVRTSLVPSDAPSWEIPALPWPSNWHASSSEWNRSVSQEDTAGSSSRASNARQPK